MANCNNLNNGMCMAGLKQLIKVLDWLLGNKKLPETAPIPLVCSEIDRERCEFYTDAWTEFIARPDVKKAIEKVCAFRGVEFSSLSLYSQKCALARDSKAPPVALAFLANSPEMNLRELVAIHQNTPPEALLLLVHDRQNRVRHTLAKNKNISRELLLMLAKDPIKYIRDRAQKRLAKENS